MERYRKKLIENPDDNSNKDMLDYIMDYKQRTLDRESDPEWQKNNMEYDMRTSKVMVEKVRSREDYAQNLYAAMCNNEFIKNDVWPLLKEQTWSASWRSSGGIIADMKGGGDYMDYYCSGIQLEWSDEEFQNATKESQEYYLWTKTKYVAEGCITEEIKQDLFDIGWLIFDGDYKNFKD